MTQKISADPTIGVRFLTHLFLLVPSDIISSVAMFRPVMPLLLDSGHRDSLDLYRLLGLPRGHAGIPAAGDLFLEELPALLVQWIENRRTLKEVISEMKTLALQAFDTALEIIRQQDSDYENV